MGNRASIEIQVDCDDLDEIVTAGHEVKGMVFLTIRRPIYGGKVRLILYGKEKTTIQTRITGSSETFHSERNLLTVYQTLKEFPPYKKITKGVYRLPFKIMLPASIPSTQQYPNGRRNLLNGFRIQYKLQASIGKIEEFTHIHVRSSPLPSDPVPCMMQPISFPISTLKLIKQGEVTLGASVADTAVGRGETIELRLACRNDSTIDIRRVAIRLVETVEWVVEAQGLTRESSRTLIYLRDVDLPSLSRERKERSEVRRLGKDSTQREVAYQAIHEDLVSGMHKIDVFVPEYSRDSYDGQVVKVSHDLLVTLQTRGISSNAFMTIPIRVGTPRSQDREGNGMEAPIQTEACSNPSYAVHMEGAEIPVVQATQVHSSDEEDDDVQSVIILSGDAVLPAHSNLADLEPLVPPFSPDVSLPNLLQRMEASTSCHSFISSLLLEAAWVRFFCAMPASDYASIIRHMTPVVEQPRVASLLAEYVNGGDALTCEWAAAAVRATDQYYRTTTAQRLLPHCTDLLRNHTAVRRELNAWEQTVTEEDFVVALEQARRQ